MFRNIFMWILTNIFKVPTETITKDIEENTKYGADYQRIDDINFASIFSNKLANYVISDSNMNIEGENARVELLNMTGQSMWKKAKKITSMAFGYGGVALVPYVKKGKLFYNIVSQDRISIDAVEGDEIKGATILAETKEITDNLLTKTYIRWVNYRIENNNLVIEQKFSDESGKEISVPSFWKNIQLKLVISGVEKVTFGFIKSPINNRKVNDKYGVPITYGCDATIKEIKDTLKQIKREFELKEAFVGVDSTMFKGNNALPVNGIYRKIDSANDDFWEVFDPAFRDSSYMARLEELYVRLEHEIGTSAGILSQVNTNNATATEIKRAMYDTFTIVDDMRSNIEKGLQDFFDACNVLANAYNLSAQGEFELTYDWSYTLLEDTTQEFTELTEGVGLGVIAKEELRNWLKPDETLEESKEKIEEIMQDVASVQDLIGNNQEENEEETEEENQEVEE